MSMEAVITRAWQAGADIILTTGLVKAGLFVALLWVAIRIVPGRYAETRARFWLFGLAALALLPVLQLDAGRLDARPAVEGERVVPKRAARPLDRHYRSSRIAAVPISPVSERVTSQVGIASR